MFSHKSLSVLAIVALSLAGSVAHAAGIKWQTNYKAALQAAKKSHKLVMVDFYAEW